MKQTKRQERLKKIAELLRSDYPTLHLFKEGGEWFIRGPYPVSFEGVVIARFLIQIFIPKDYPQSMPLVEEVGGRIPRTIERHVTIDNYCCLFLPDERWKYWPPGSDILDFLRGPVNDYFLSQLCFEKNNPWPFGERRHGRSGILDYYFEELGTTNELIVLRCLEYLGQKQPKGHWTCYCGSGRKMRHCHFEKIIELRDKIDLDTARYTYDILASTHPAFADKLANPQRRRKKLR